MYWAKFSQDDWFERSKKNGQDPDETWRWVQEYIRTGGPPRQGPGEIIVLPAEEVADEPPHVLRFMRKYIDGSK